MKVRAGFVSNSSSSSYVVVGVNRYENYPNENNSWKKLAKVLEIPKEFDERLEYEYYGGGKNFVENGYGVYKAPNKSEICTFGMENRIIGFNAESFLKKDMIVSEIKKELQNRIKKYYNVDIDLKDIDFLVIECSSEY